LRAAQSKHLSFCGPDENDPVEFDKLLWSYIAGPDVAYPATRSGLDLSLDRDALLRTDKAPVGDD
jgi:hypothetical protein